MNIISRNLLPIHSDHFYERKVEKDCTLGDFQHNWGCTTVFVELFESKDEKKIVDVILVEKVRTKYQTL